MSHRKVVCVSHTVYLLCSYDAAKFIIYISGRQQLFLQYIHFLLINIDDEQQLFPPKLLSLTEKNNNTP